MPEQPKPAVPRIVPGVEVTKLPLAPIEGFVFSRIDGRASLDEIADSTAQTKHDVRQIVERLVELGAAEWVGGDGTARAAARPPSAPADADRADDGAGASPTPAVSEGSEPPYDPAELEEEGIALDMTRRRQVLETYYRLDELNHYEVLGVSLEADKAEIRNAYFGLSKIFHPDTLYGKQLGSYKRKMEVIFHRLTEAYEVLGRKKKRQEYDEYLRIHQETERAQQRLEAAYREAENIEQQGVEVEASEQPPADEGEQPAVEGARDVTRPAARTPSSDRTAATQRTRRQRLARQLTRLTGYTPTSKPPAPSSSSAQSQPPSPPSSPATSRPAPPRSGPPSKRPPTTGARQETLRSLAASLKQTATHTGGVHRLERHLEDARRAEEHGDLVGATNALRLALALAPDQKEIQHEHERLARELAGQMADRYEKQAKYEEGQGKWAAAATSWKRVAEGRPRDANAALRAARALLESEGDLHKARALAQRAAELDPDNAQAHRELGRAFLGSGLKSNARRALETATRLDPNDEMADNLLRDLKR